MHKLFAGIVIASLLSIATTPAAAQQQSSKQDDIRTLIELTGAARIADQIVDLMMPQMLAFIRKLRPDTSVGNLNLLSGEMADLFHNSAPELIENMIPLYEKRFSQQEVRDVIAFYKTPTGQKMLIELPGLLTESVQLGQQWGQAVGQAAVQRIQVRIKELGI